MRPFKQKFMLATILCLFISLFLGCYAMRPDEIQPEEVSATWDKHFPKHPDFTQENVLFLDVGMTAMEVETIFGAPDKTFFKTYWGPSGDPFQRMVYIYNMGRHPKGMYGNNVNTLVFTTNGDSPRLVHWDIQLAYPIKLVTVSH
jgi:hypothetical protein